MSETIFTKNNPIGTWRSGDTFEDVFIIQSVQKRAKKNGEPFYAVTLADLSGTIEGMVWNDIDAFEARGYRRDNYVQAKGIVGEYNGRLNCTIKFMRPLSSDQIRPEDFVPVSPRPLDEMVSEFRALVAQVKDPELSALLACVFDERGKLYRDFILAPSARQVHQAYLHGLLEHTLNVASSALSIAGAPAYAGMIDRDLLLAGALVHDIGKTVEYRWEPRIDYTEVGQLMGHISIGSNMLAEIARHVKIGTGKLAHLQHMVLSHHGRLEYGSPRLPATAEAFVLHYADLADAQLAVYHELSEAAREQGEPVSPWSPFIERRAIALDSDFAAPAQAREYLDDLEALRTAKVRTDKKQRKDAEESAGSELFTDV